MNELYAGLAKIGSSSKGVIHFLNKHHKTLVFFIGSIAIMLSLLQTRSYLNPVRDDALYTELSTEINYQGIDEDIFEKLQSTQNDREVEVNTNFVPDRSNPFSE